MMLMGSAVTYVTRAGKEQRDAIVAKHLPSRDKKELIDCSSRRHVVVSLPRCCCWHSIKGLCLITLSVSV